MRRSIRISVLIVALVGALLLGVGLAFLRSPTTPFSDLSSGGQLESAIEFSDAIVTGSGLRSDGRVEAGDWTYDQLSVNINEVVYSAKQTLSELRMGEDLEAAFGANVDKSPVSIVPGHLDVHYASSLHGEDLPMPDLAALESDGDFVMVLTFVDRRLWPDHPTDWIVELIATDTDLEHASFFSSEYAEDWKAQLGLLIDRGVVEASDPLREVLAAWLAGADQDRATGVASEFAVAARAATRPSTLSLDELWYATPVDERPLDPELTPEAELAEMTMVSAFIDVRAVISDRDYLVIRTSAGISHIARLSAGSHPATLITPPDGDWIVELTNDGGSDRVKLLEVPANDRGGTKYSMIVVDSEGSATAGDAQAHFEALTENEFREQIELFGASTTAIP